MSLMFIFRNEIRAIKPKCITSKHDILPHIRMQKCPYTILCHLLNESLQMQTLFICLPPT